MKCLDFFDSEEAARQARIRLLEKGIVTRIVVDPLACRYPALADFQGVALLVPDDQLDVARVWIGTHPKAAG